MCTVSSTDIAPGHQHLCPEHHAQPASECRWEPKSALSIARCSAQAHPCCKWHTFICFPWTFLLHPALHGNSSSWYLKWDDSLPKCLKCHRLWRVGATKFISLPPSSLSSALLSGHIFSLTPPYCEWGNVEGEFSNFLLPAHRLTNLACFNLRSPSFPFSGAL